MLRDSVDALHAGEGAAVRRLRNQPSQGSGVCCDTYWVGESKVSMARGSRRPGRPGGLYGDTHRVPRVEKDLQVAARVAGVRE